MILLTLEEILSLHSKIIKQTGGSDGLRDRGLLESAIYSANASFDGMDVYPTCIEKAARLAFSITNNHAFVDGNKRIGIFVLLMTLRLNNITIKYTQAELIALGLGIADGSLDYDAILAWIRTHMV